MGFLILGMTSFGGVMPMARRMLVEQRRWLTAEQFIEILGLCQFLPGGNIINVSVAVGLKFRGVAGAFAAAGGLIAAPTVVVLLLGMVYDRFSDDPHLQHLFAGLAAAAAGLLVSMAVKVARQVRGDRLAIVIALASFVVIAILRVPLLTAMLILTPLSVFIMWRLRR